MLSELPETQRKVLAKLDTDADGVVSGREASKFVSHESIAARVTSRAAIVLTALLVISVGVCVVGGGRGARVNAGASQGNGLGVCGLLRV